MIFIGYLISTISLKWDNKDKKENINESTDLKVEQIESNQESEENKKD